MVTRNVTEFLTKVQRARKGAFYITIPDAIIQKMRLKPFMAAKMIADKKGIRVFGFEKTVKIKLDLSKKTIALLKKIMKMEGYGSIDETVCNVVDGVFARENKKERKTAIVYLYPIGFLESKFVLIGEYEKSNKAKDRKKDQKIA